MPSEESQIQRATQCMMPLYEISRTGETAEPIERQLVDSRDWGEERKKTLLNKYELTSVQSLSRVQLFTTPRTTAPQASLYITNSWSLLKLMSIESVIPSKHLVLSSPSPPTVNLAQHQGLFQWVSTSHQVAKILEFQLQHQSFQWIFRTYFL